MWKMMDTSRKGEVKSLELALIDAQGSKIQATIPARFMRDFKDWLEEGCCRKISCFDHALNINGAYQCAKHEYKIVFEPNTLVQTVDSMKVTLWGEHADLITNYMSKEPEFPVVLIVQIYLDDMNIPAIYEYKHRLEQNDIKEASIHKISIMSSISGYTTFDDFVKDSEILTLNEIRDLEEAGYVVVFGKISGIAKEYDWSYLGYMECNRNVIKIEDAEMPKSAGKSKTLSFGKKKQTADDKSQVPKKWMCNRHGPVSAVAPKFKLQVYLMDGSGSRIVTLWDRMVYTFINKTTAELREKDKDDYPKILDEIIGKKCLFRLDVSDYNITNNTSEIAVTRVTTDADVIKKYLDVVSEIQEIDPELSAEFAANLTPTQDSTTKTAASCTGDSGNGNAGDDRADSPPPKKMIPI
ncbi:OLC1v1023068C1 [Oldenlandia corymbosa var. corymbosa]|uniref:OLC1v1023068C1 n=1 Tax=Oldenlandia corymbosa var. corymbosa TaxID=529605 RepID=A0AAV1C0J6_OLDCO|nr:OLC1v1023068C1 [Oldenlandia corymbosa var. corymbosa]